MGLGLSQTRRLAQTVSPRQVIQARLLALSLPALRADILTEMASNPAIEDIDHPIETPLSEVQREALEINETSNPDYPEDDFVPGLDRDEEAAERRQAFFDAQVKQETLQEHLITQFPLSDIPECDWPLAETLVGDLDDKGYYKGSIADVAMAFERSCAQVNATLALIRELDPPGCGARDLKECLLAQVDDIQDANLRTLVTKLISDHLEDIASGQLKALATKLGITDHNLRKALTALRSLDGRPGRQYPSEHERVEYVNPEIHAVKRNNVWAAETDERSLPEIRISPKFKALLEDPNQTEETKSYIRERIAAALAFKEAVTRRQQTVSAIANAIFERQQDFFTKGFAALNPLTEQEIANKVGVHTTTVSRTVRDKYASTPQGTVELRRLFASKVKTAVGSEVSQNAVLSELKQIVSEEDGKNPLSDNKIAELLSKAGFPIARRTVAKYRMRLKIPDAAARRN